MAQFNLNDYITVQDRINRFWTEYPDGAIRTDLASDIVDFKTCRYRAEVFKHRDHPRPDAVGYAFEIAGQGMANKTSHEENAETSAIGRALANLGYATSQKDRPSREEMNKVQRQRLPDIPVPPEHERGDTPEPDYSNDPAWQINLDDLVAAIEQQVPEIDGHAVVTAMAKIKKVKDEYQLDAKTLGKMIEFARSEHFVPYYTETITPYLAGEK